MFCAMATVIDRCKTEGVVDVFQVVKALRVQKPGAVPTMVWGLFVSWLVPASLSLSMLQVSYNTVWDATLTFLDSLDIYANFQDV